MSVPSRSHIRGLKFGRAPEASPCVVSGLSAPCLHKDRALATVIQRTTSESGWRFEVEIQEQFTGKTLVETQSLLTLPHGVLYHYARYSLVLEVERIGDTLRI